MKTTIYGQDARVSAWVGERVDEENFAGAVALGLEQDGELVAGVVFNEYTGTNINIHVAAVPGKRWMNRDFLFRVFAYPFLQLKCNRVTGLVRVDNLPAQKFNEHLGFVREGIVRSACKDGTNMILYGMLATECKFLRLGSH